MQLIRENFDVPLTGSQLRKFLHLYQNDATQIPEELTHSLHFQHKTQNHTTINNFFPKQNTQKKYKNIVKILLLRSFTDKVKDKNRKVHPV